MDPKDVVSRFGSDEFILLKRGVIEQNLSKFVRNSVEKIREKSFFIDKTEIKLTISAGIVLYPRDYIEIEALINYAQASCKKVKDLGKNQCTFFNKEIYNNFLEEYTLYNEVSKGLEKEEFELYFQSRDTIHNLSLLILLRL